MAGRKWRIGDASEEGVVGLRAGRLAPRPPGILAVRELARADLARLAKKRAKLAPPVQRIRDTHHNLARLCALGTMRDFEIAQATGYSSSRITILRADPAFQALVEEYRGLVNATYAESVDTYMALLTSNALRAERMLADKLEEAEAEGASLPVRDLVAISRDAADRTGYGKKQTNLNVNVDFAAALERAIARSKTIEAVE